MALVMGAMVFVPVLLDLLHGGTRAAFRYLAPDSFYYNTVARNIALYGSTSYDGQLPTNGFHPLWQATLAALYFVLHHLGLSESSYLVSSVLLSALLVAASVTIVGHAVMASGRTLGPAALLAPVGLYAVLILPAWLLMVDVRGLTLPTQGPFPLFGTAWSFANGMESGLVLLFLALLGKALAKDVPFSSRRAATLGGLCLGMVLSRLDHVYFAMGVAVVLAVRNSNTSAPHRLRPWGVCALCFIGPLLAYLLINRLYSGAAFPLSGAIKTSFPFPNADNVDNLVAVVARPWRDMLAPSRFYRAAQLVLPSLFAIAYLARRCWRRTERDGLADFTTALAVGTLLLAAYDFLFVPTFAMGHWYTPASIAFVSVAAVAAVRGSARLTISRARRRPVWLGALATLGAGLLCVMIFYFLQRRGGYHTLYADLYLVDAPAARAFYGQQRPRLLEYDDGIVAFSTAFPTMSGTGHAADGEAAVALTKGTLQQLALERGFDRVASLVYLPSDAARQGVPARSLPAMALESVQRQAGGFHARLEFVAPSGRFCIIRVAR
jgi:hypothetical protein